MLPGWAALIVKVFAEPTRELTWKPIIFRMAHPRHPRESGT